MKAKLDSAEKKTLIAWIIVGIVMMIFIAVFYIQVELKDKKKDGKDEYKIVTDVDRYYTVRSAMAKYYSFLSSKDYEKLIKTLDSKYVKDNNITVDNVKDILTESELEISYITKLMCSKEKKTGIVSYLVSGVEEDMWTGERKDKKYYEIVLDGNNFSFAITPISESDFGGECK